MTCTNCIHKDVCCMIEYYDRDLNSNEPCDHFRDFTNMVELPCKLGDTVYEILNPFRTEPYFITSTVCAVHITDGSRNSCNHKRENYFLAECPNTKYVKKYPFSKIGKTVFFSREEAKIALRESEQRGD